MNKIFTPTNKYIFKLLAIALTISTISTTQLTQAQNKDIPERVVNLIQERCAVCHGEKGESTSPLFPKLAGSHPQYFAKQMSDFATGVRNTKTMRLQMRNVKPEDFLAMGKYYESLAPSYVKDIKVSQKGKDLYHKGRPADGVIACSACHGERGLGAANLPRLAGQIPEYTINQLEQFSSRSRTNDNAIMQDIAKKLTAEENIEVANYVATLK